MSALYVRNTIRAWAQLISGPLGVQFYDTVNREQKPEDVTWWTVEFYADNYDGETFCGPGFIEGGAVRVVVLSRPGVGDEDAIDALERIVREFFNLNDPTQRLALTTFEPAQEDSGGSADRNYRVGAFINYRLSL
jgi:hypothetical protein